MSPPPDSLIKAEQLDRCQSSDWHSKRVLVRTRIRELPEEVFMFVELGLAGSGCIYCVYWMSRAWIWAFINTSLPCSNNSTGLYSKIFTSNKALLQCRISCTSLSLMNTGHTSLFVFISNYIGVLSAPTNTKKGLLVNKSASCYIHAHLNQRFNSCAVL